jgi:hypothetical protein
LSFSLNVFSSLVSKIYINLLEIKLEQIYQEKAKGAQVRAREQWVELGEKNNSYFLGLEKERQVKKSINKIKNENNDISKRLIWSFKFLSSTFILSRFANFARFGALKSDSTHHFFRNACTKSGSLRFSQFSGC